MTLSNSKLKNVFPNNDTQDIPCPIADFVLENSLSSLNNEPYSTGLLPKENRKSLSTRRVSFASTARVRVFDDISDSPITKQTRFPSPQFSQTNEDDSFEIKLSESSNLDDMDLTTCVGGILITTNEAMDSTLLTQNISEELSIRNIISSHCEMEETQCVGGILEESMSTCKDAIEISNGVEEFIVPDMDFTSTVGSFIETPISNLRQTMDNSPVVDMEMTTCVGMILASDSSSLKLATDDVVHVELDYPQTNFSPTVNSISDEMNKNNLTTYDQFTQKELTSTFKESGEISNAGFNESFLPRLSLDSSKRLSIGIQENYSDKNYTPTKSVIWKICSPITGRKASLGMVFSPVTSSNINSPLTNIDPAKISSTNIPMTSYSPYVEKLKEDISKAKDSPLVIGTPKWRALASPLRNKLSELRSSPLNEPLFSSPVHRLSSLISAPIESQDISLIEDIEQPQLIDISDSPVLRALKKTKTISLQESTDSDMRSAIPIANLKQFLSDSSIRFLDNITSSTTRRETLSKSRESGEYSAKRLLFHACVTMPECELFEQSCEVLETRISDIRSELHLLETKFEGSPPFSYTYFYNIVENEDLKQQKMRKFRSIKNHSRSLVQAQWYTWRRSLIVPLVDILVSISEKLSGDLQILDHAIQEYSIITSNLNVDKKSLSNQSSKLNEKANELSLFDWVRYDETVKLLNETDTVIQHITGQVASNRQALIAIQAELLSIQNKKDSLVSKIDAFSRELDDLSEISKLDADLAKVNFELTTKSLGTSLVKIDRQFAILKSTFFTYSYSFQVVFTNGFIADISILPSQVKTTSSQLFLLICSSFLPTWISPVILNTNLPAKDFNKVNELLFGMKLFEMELDVLQFTHPIQISAVGSLFLKLEIDFINVEKQRRSTAEIIVDISNGFYPMLQLTSLKCSSLSSIESTEILTSIISQHLPSYRLISELCQKLREIL